VEFDVSNKTPCSQSMVNPDKVEVKHDLEWRRTCPDLKVYIPSAELGDDAENQHFLVLPTKRGAWLAVWTMATRENHMDQRVVVSRSIDKGATWTRPVVIDGQADNNGQRASWGFPFVVPEMGRIYVFYNKNIGVTDAREDTTGVLRFRYSDDDGLTWSKETHDLRIGDAAIDHPDPAQPKNWIVFQIPIILDGQVVTGFTRWASRQYDATRDLFKQNSEIFFINFENILTERNPARLTISTLPGSGHGLRVPRRDMPSVSVAQEPTLVRLSDGRWVCAMRNLNGDISIAISSDRGRSWTDTYPVRSGPGGEVMHNPIAPCPMYDLGDGRYLLLFYNNDGTANGGKGPSDYTKNRFPAYITIGRETGDAQQPLRFGKPKMLCTSNGVRLGPSGRTEVATYPSLLQENGLRVLFYPDRKHFLLGKYISDEWLRDCDPDQTENQR